MPEPRFHDTAPDFLPDEPPRKMVATQQEMMDAKMPLHLRDYCAHLAIPLLKCRVDNGTWPWACKYEYGEWNECQIQDYYRRMRDRRRETLKQRAEQKAANEAAVVASE